MDSAKTLFLVALAVCAVSISSAVPRRSRQDGSSTVIMDSTVSPMDSTTVEVMDSTTDDGDMTTQIEEVSLLTHVTDAGTGLDIADATIIYTTLDGNSIGGGQTDNVGELLLEDLGFYAGEDILLTVTKEGYVSVINQEVILSDAELQREEVALMQE